ncbi:hypothetical protein ACIBI3_02240 [Actinomadura luteofluorescens]|uniref:hypothetical protein n=1 Tax=Actinomadura luteofluorescens TaxID=46163 RepID=UPI00347F85BC
MNWPVVVEHHHVWTAHCRHQACPEPHILALTLSIRDAEKAAAIHLNEINGPLALNPPKGT